MSGTMAFVALAVTSTMVVLGAPQQLGRVMIMTARARVWCLAAWSELIRFTTPVFLAIRPSPKPIMVSSKGGTIFGT